MSRHSGPFVEVRVDLAAPDIVGALPPIDDGEENLLPKDAWLRPLRVEFERWSDSAPEKGMFDTVQLFFDHGEDPLHERRLEGPIPDTEFWLEVPPKELGEGVHTLFYRVLPWNTPTPRESFPVNFTVDKSAPIFAADSKLIFPAEILPPDNSITARYLSNHDDQVLTTVPDYNEKKVGDVITWYWENFPDGLAVVDTMTLELDDLNKPLELVFPGKMLRDRGNGQRYATYRVLDRAGNSTGLSARETLTVDIQPPPLRKHPIVRESQNSGATGLLETMHYGVSGVTVVVPKQDDAGPDDTFEVYWKGYGDVGSHYAPLPISADPSQFRIPPTAIPANIGAGREIEIRYVVNHPGADPERSDPFKLTLKSILPPKFPLIDCPAAARGSPLKLSLKTVPEDGTRLTLERWVYQADTQLINIWLTDADGRTEDIRVAYPVTIGQNRAMLPRTFLTSVRINTTFSVHVSVSFDGGDSYLSFLSQRIQLLV